MRGEVPTARRRERREPPLVGAVGAGRGGVGVSCGAARRAGCGGRVRRSVRSGWGLRAAARVWARVCGQLVVVVFRCRSVIGCRVSLGRGRRVRGCSVAGGRCGGWVGVWRDGHGGRAPLGVETQRQGPDPALLGLYSLVCRWAGDILVRSPYPFMAAWYQKTLSAFSDAIAAARTEIWLDSIFSRSPSDPERNEMPPPGTAGSIVHGLAEH